MPADPRWVLNNSTGIYKWTGTGAPPTTSHPPGFPDGKIGVEFATKIKSSSVSGAKTAGLKSKPTLSKPKPSKPAKPYNSASSSTSTTTSVSYNYTPVLGGTSTGTSVSVAAAGGVAILAVGTLAAGLAVPGGIGTGIGLMLQGVTVSLLPLAPSLIPLIVIGVIIIIWAVVTLITDLTTLKTRTEYSQQTRGNVYNSSGFTSHFAPNGMVSTWGYPATPQSVSRSGVQELVIAEKIFGNFGEVSGHIDVTEFWTVSLAKGAAYSDDVSLNNARLFLEFQLQARPEFIGTKRYMTLEGTPEFVAEFNTIEPPPDIVPLPPDFLPITGNPTELAGDNEAIYAENFQRLDDWRIANPNWDYTGNAYFPADPNKVQWLYPDTTNEIYGLFETGQIVKIPASYNTKNYTIDFVSNSDSYEFPLTQWFHYTFACKVSIPFSILYGAGMFDNTLMSVLLSVQTYNGKPPKTFSDNFCAVGVGNSKVPSAYLLRVTPLPNLPAGTGNGKGVYALELTPPEPDTVALALGVLLAAPIALPALSITTSSFIAFWTQVPNALDYLLEVSTTNDFSTTVLSGQVVSGTSFLVPNLISNTTYYYRVRARAGNSVSGFSNVIPVQTLVLNLDAPVATAATTVLTDQFTANWQPVANAVDYLLDVSTAVDFSAPVLTGQVVSSTGFLVPLLTANTRYYYRVRARNGAVVSANSNVITLLTSNVVVPPVASLDAPVATPASALTHQSFNANWLPVVNANDYLLDVATDAGFSSLIVTGRVVNGTLSAVTGLTPLTPYWYRVRARNGAVLSPYSNVINPTTLDTPLPAPVANAAGGTVNFTASWSAVPTADDYVLDVSTSPTFNTFVVQAQTVAGTAQFVGGLTGGGTYFYRVRARRGATFSPNSNTITVQLGLATPADPVATAPTNVTSTSFTANWNNVTGAADFLLDVATDAGFSSLVVNNRVVAALSSDVTGLSSQVQYWYRVRARNATGTSNNSNVITLVTSPLAQPGAPNILPCTNIGATNFQANWTLVPGALVYTVQVATDSAFSSIVQTQGTGVQNFFPFAGLATNTTYYVRVRCNNPLANPSQSAFSGTAEVRLGVLAGGTFPQPPLSGFPFGVPTEITTNSFRLHWTPQQDRDFLNNPVANTPVGQTYELDVARDNTFTDFLANNQAVSSLTTALSNVQNNPAFYYGIFYYRLRARSQDGTLVSGNSATYSVQMPIPNPDVVTPFLTSENITTTSIDVRLNNRDPRIFRGNVDSALGDFYRLEVSLSPSFAQVHVLNIQAGNVVQAAGMTAPGNAGADASYLSFPTLSVQGLQPATQYYFRFRALFNFPYTPYGASITATTLGVPNTPPTVLPATQIGQCRFQANWQTNNVASYDVEVQKSPSGDFVRLDNLAALLLLVNEPQVQPTNFAYRVRSVSAQGARSPYSALQPVIMQPFFDPVAMTPSLITTTSFRLNWTAQVNAVQYRIEIYQGATLLINTIVATTQFDTQSVMALTPDTVYTVQIFPRNVYGEQYMNPNLAPIIQVVQTLGAMSVIPPAAPSLAFVSSSTTTITLNLTGTVANTDYTLDVATDAAFTNLVASGLYAEAGNNVVAALQPDTMYYARARAYNGAYSPYTATASGRTQLGAPHLLVGEEIAMTSFRLRWTAPQTVVQTRLDVARDAAFTDFVLQDFVVVGLLTTVVSGLVQETTYWARVRTENARGITPYSNVRQITTDSEDVEVNVAVIR